MHVQFFVQGSGKENTSSVPGTVYISTRRPEAWVVRSLMLRAVPGNIMGRKTIQAKKK